MAGSKTFGNDLRDARQQAGLTQVKLAAQLGVDPGAVSGWERGIRMPDEQNRETVARFLGLSLADYLVRYEAEGRQAPPAPPPARGETGTDGALEERYRRLLELAEGMAERVEQLERAIEDQEASVPSRAVARGGRAKR